MRLDYKVNKTNNLLSFMKTQFKIMLINTQRTTFPYHMLPCKLFRRLFIHEQFSVITYSIQIFLEISHLMVS